MQERQQVNVNGKRLNKLEEIVRLLQKLNEELYSKEYLEQNGYPLELHLVCNGSGYLQDSPYYEMFRFEDLGMLERFLRAQQLERFALLNNQKGKK